MFEITNVTAKLCADASRINDDFYVLCVHSVPIVFGTERYTTDVTISIRKMPYGDAVITFSDTAAWIPLHDAGLIDVKEDYDEHDGRWRISTLIWTGPIPQREQEEQEEKFQRQAETSARSPMSRKNNQGHHRPIKEQHVPGI